MTSSYKQLLNDYPKRMSMEQMRFVCHISKKTARLLLQIGLIPSVNNGKKTRKYQIATVDVIAYLKERDVNPEKYALPEGCYAREQSITSDSSPFRIDRRLFEESPDILTVHQAAVIAGVSPHTVTAWVRKKDFKAFISSPYRIPKISLLIYLSSPKHSKNYKRFIRPRHQRVAATD